MRKLILWVPVLMVGSLVYWTIALNFGGLSLLALSSLAVPGGDDLQFERLDQRDSYQPITVNVTDRDEGAARASDFAPLDIDVISDCESARADQRGAGDRGGRNDQGPGETAF